MSAILKLRQTISIVEIAFLFERSKRISRLRQDNAPAKTAMDQTHNPNKKKAFCSE